jgi:hypothetical protein
MWNENVGCRMTFRAEGKLNPILTIAIYRTSLPQADRRVPGPGDNHLVLIGSVVHYSVISLFWGLYFTPILSYTQMY